MPTLTSLAPGALAGLIALAAAGAHFARPESPSAQLALAGPTPSVEVPGYANDQMQLVLDQHEALWAEPLESRTPKLARQLPTLADAAIALVADDGRSTDPTSLLPGIGAADIRLKGTTGTLPARVYTPSGKGPFPAILYFHGGGFVVGSVDSYDLSARGIAERTKSVVVSVEYGLAPEKKFPAAHNDALSAWRWLVENASKYNADSTRLALAGEGAGGTLAMATAIAVREKKMLAPAHVLAVHPIASTDTTTASYSESANGPSVNKGTMTWFFKHALSSAADRHDPRLDLLSADLRNLPPVTIVAAERDPLRSEGIMLAERLRSAGVDVQRQEWPGVTQDFFGLTPVLQAARDAQRFAGLRLRRSLGLN